MEEIAWANLVTSSNYLADLLGQNKDSIIIPKNFSQYLNKTYKMPEKVFEKAQERQDKQMSILDKNINSLLVKYRENQEKPDLTLSINCNLAQDPTYFAYPTITESLSKLFKPDNSYFYIGIDYKLPIGNNAASAALCQARIRERQSEIKIKNQESQINQEVNIAISNFKSSEFQISKTKENLKLRQNIFDEAHSLSRTKDTNIFEYLKKYDELLDAELAYLDALISYQKAHVNLQATQGILAKKGN